ncbi:MAG: DUF3014 domain-containing protein, partial [Deltaproteobacteria bacterium]|nr:DUF3014 domain-containing protein [Deltaproteobacteria bacterium]
MSSPSPPPPDRPWALWVIAALVVVALAVGGLAYFGVISLPFDLGFSARDGVSGAADASSTSSNGLAAADAAPEQDGGDQGGGLSDDAGGDALAAPLGPDGELRRLLDMASTSRRLRSWAKADGILKRLVAAVWLVAQGRSPRAVVSFLEIEGDFTVLDRRDGIFVDPASYHRYDAFAQAVRA